MSEHVQGSAILVVEDQALVALDIEDALERAGLAPILFNSCAKAEGYLSEYRPDAAVLDIRLPDGECTNVAEKLVDLGVPFVVHTGALIDGVDPVFRLGEFVPKPADVETIVERVRSMLSLAGPDQYVPGAGSKP